MSRLLRCTMVVLAASAGCALEDPDPMTEQDRYEAYETGPFFEDGRAMRQPPEGTVARTQLPLLRGRRAAFAPDGGYLEEIPIPLTPLLMERARVKFDVYCAACHGRLGNGDSFVAHNMPLRPPPSLLLVLQTHPPGYIYNVITRGYGVMPSYEAQIAPEERWAIVAYLRALHRSQHGTLEDAPPEVRALLLVPPDAGDPLLPSPEYEERLERDAP